MITNIETSSGEGMTIMDEIEVILENLRIKFLQDTEIQADPQNKPNRLEPTTGNYKRKLSDIEGAV